MGGELTFERLREILHYDPETGVFRWKAGVSRVIHVGDVAGATDTKGHRQIKVDGRAYLAHRLAWIYVHGEWPSVQIDHINCDKSDNRIANLRLATQSQNQSNCGAPKNNTSGFKGVSWNKRDRIWSASIGVDHKKIFLGYFETARQAALAYDVAHRFSQLDFARCNFSPEAITNVRLSKRAMLNLAFAVCAPGAEFSEAA